MSRFLLPEIKATVLPSWRFDGYLDHFWGLNSYGWNLITIVAAFLVAQIVNVILAWVILNALNQILLL